MANYFVFSSEESSAFDFDGPTYDEIRSAFSGIQMNGAAWVGPGPRVTRHSVLGDFRGLKTDAVWVLQMDYDTYNITPPGTSSSTNATAAQAAQILAQYLQAALAQNSSTWSTIQVSPYNAAVNGALSFWTCSAGNQAECASVTQTRDSYPTGGGRIDAAENPVGPTSAATHPTTATQAVGQVGSAIGNAVTGGILPTPQAAQSYADLLKIGAIVVVGAVGLYLAWPLLSGIRQSEVYAQRAAQPVYANPAGRRRRRR